MNQEPLPQIHLIRDTDLSVFAYELHIFAGDFLRECEFNMRSLATNTGADSIAIMGKNHMWLSDALFAYSTMFRQWIDQAFRYMPQDLEERLNMQYMEAAQNPDMDKYRIPQGTAKQMLLYDEAPVYRLLPSGSEKIAPIAAISTGLWYENYREFAIAPEDLGALDKLIRRETDRLTGNLPQLHKNEERRPAPER